MRLHPETRRLPGSLRYLAPPAMVVAVTAGTVAGVVGAATGSRWPLAGFLVPAGYVAAITAGGAVFGRGLPIRAHVELPLVYAVMHWSWGVGFVVGAREN